MTCPSWSTRSASSSAAPSSRFISSCIRYWMSAATAAADRRCRRVGNGRARTGRRTAQSRGSSTRSIVKPTPAQIEKIQRESRPHCADVRARRRGLGSDARAGRASSSPRSKRTPQPVPADDVAEARHLLEWMEARHFVFLGYRHYTPRARRAGRPPRPGAALRPRHPPRRQTQTQRRRRHVLRGRHARQGSRAGAVDSDQSQFHLDASIATNTSTMSA